jgi:UDP-N-acetyl-D-galactosamine dehydrogenase
MNLIGIKLAIIGLGYVGLPLAVEFGKKRKVVAYDSNKKRISELRAGIDKTLEIRNKNFLLSKKIFFTSYSKNLAKCNFYIIAVPTPIFKNKKPNMTYLEQACNAVGLFLKKKDIVVFESTVYPGATEEVCVPILQKISKLKLNDDFFVGYSPERINPGDKHHKLADIIKVTSGSTIQTGITVNALYSSIIKAGTYMAPSIKIAEAAKVIENTQRDLNIAFMNELSLIFKKMNIDTGEVLEAAGTKWNFLKFKPGLVGGHCIGVDPYYLTYKAKSLGYNPKIILAGRAINNFMSSFIVSQLRIKMKEKNINMKKSNILIMGLTFKENCPDIRNSKVFEVIAKLTKLKARVDCYDPWVNQNNLFADNNVKKLKKIKKNYYDSIVIAVPHKKFLDLGIQNIKKFAKKNNVIYDVKSIFSSKLSDLQL